MRRSTVEHRLLLVELSEILVSMSKVHVFLRSRVSNIIITICVAHRTASIATKQLM